MKHYNLHLAVTIGTMVNYNQEYALKFDINEKLPMNVDSEKYIRQRLAEELKRHFGSLVEPIDNKTDEAKASADPLDNDCPF